MISLVLNFGYITFEKNNKEYWTTEQVASLITCLEKLPFWVAFHYTRDWASEYVTYNPIENRNGLHQYLLEQTSEYRETRKLNFEANNTCSYLDIDIGSQQIAISLSLKKRDYQSFGLQKTAIPLLKSFVFDVINQFTDITSIERTISFNAYGSTYYKVRPPFTTAGSRWDTHSLLDMIDERSLTKDKNEKTIVMQAIDNLPDFVLYEKKDFFHILTWTNDLSDEQAISQVLTERNKWLHKYIPLKRDCSYNKFGDVKSMDVYIDMPKNKYLTYYDTDVNEVPYGFKSMVILPDGSMDDELLNNLSDWVKQEKLPDGTPIKKIGLIMQDRASALLIANKAKRLGLHQVLYRDHNNNFWNINPKGLWLN